MDVWILLLQGASLIGLGVLGALIKFFPAGYLGEKGKNLATKEDVAEITDRIERVKGQYSAELEATKAELSSKLKTHGFRYEKEFQVLEILSERLVRVRDCSRALRPIMDLVDPAKSKDEIKSERLKASWESRRDLYLIRETKRPFFPEDIYQAILAVEKVASTEAIRYQYQELGEDGVDFRKYWEEAETNQQAVSERADEALQLIRLRITQWDSLASE